jgi:hypothetical protein
VFPVRHKRNFFIYYLEEIRSLKGQIGDSASLRIGLDGYCGEG